MLFCSISICPDLTGIIGAARSAQFQPAPFCSYQRAAARWIRLWHWKTGRTISLQSQAQRTAIARALIHRPQLILADEPTGNLDSKSARDVLELLSWLSKEQEATMVMVTHDALAASFCDRVVFIRDGKLYNEIYNGDNRKLFIRRLSAFWHYGEDIDVTFRQKGLHGLFFKRGVCRCGVLYFFHAEI